MSEDFQLACRLAKAITGEEIQERCDDPIHPYSKYFLITDGFHAEWRNAENILRNNGEDGQCLLDINIWTPNSSRFHLPNGITKDSSTKEIDFILTVLGY